MFLLHILCKLCVDGKQVSIILRNLAPILVDTLAEKGGGLNQVMLRPRVFFLLRFFAFISYFNTVP